MDKHDGKPHGIERTEEIERTDGKGENRTRIHDGTDRTDSHVGKTERSARRAND
jgi:hypothetical protein